MSSVELYKELVSDESGLPLTRRTLIEGVLNLPNFGSFDIRHRGQKVLISTTDAPKFKAVLPEGGNIVIAQNSELRWRLVHKSKLPG